MGMVFLSLMPATIVGVIVNGWHAAFIILAAIASAVGTEFLFDLLCKKGSKSYLDGSAAVTGLLLALSLSPDTPIYGPILGSIFAILVVKCCFGGLGKNFLNPALAGRCFLLISFSNSMAPPLSRHANTAIGVSAGMNALESTLPAAGSMSMIL